MIIRAPAVAGTFYNLNPEMLRKQIEASFQHKLGPKIMEKKLIISTIVPHAGYEYSGAIAAWAYSKIEKANYLLLGPNHSGIGAKFAVMKEGLWKTPLGGIAIDSKMAEEIIEKCKLIEHDIIPHEHEHSIEVQLPFLQYRFGSDFKFVPISILNEFADEEFLNECKLVGKCLAEIIKKRKEKWIVIASSDFSHYLPAEIAEDIDNYVIAAILKLNEKEFFSRINERNASLCGFGPIAIAIVIAKELGAKKSELLKYANSGDVTGDYSSVVGYASAIIY